MVQTNSPKSAGDKLRIRQRLDRLTRRVDAAGAVDLARGRMLFEATCTAGHSTSNSGSGFDPSLSGSKNRTTEAILTAVLDPSQAGENVFRTFHVETTEGESYDGLFGDETRDFRTVRFAGVARQVVPITSIKKAGYVAGSSQMPDGLVEAPDDSQITDLVRYGQSPK